ncbi:MAG: LamG domain-containing protein [Opitutaceae bacterium]|jgi:hypothetical protein|nr:LamG domain-containing protein [Opitutaceae bacterium]
MNKKPMITALLAGLATAALTLTAAASTVGYWRFEDGAFTTDSSGNNLTLTNNNSTTAQALPDTGAGSNFLNPVPATNAANTQAAKFANGSITNFSLADTALLTVQDFTIEAMINAGSFQAGAGSRIIASQWGSDSKNLGWLLGVSGTSGASVGANKLILQISSTGTDSLTFSSGITLSAGVDYYVAASLAFNDTLEPTSATVTFYIQDLASPEAFLQIITTGPQSVTGIYNSTTTFRIGATTSLGGGVWTGLIDEVRLSNTALGQSDLLISNIPEPHTAALGVGTLAAGVFLLRRRITGI